MPKPSFLTSGAAPHAARELAAGNHNSNEVVGARAATGTLTFAVNPSIGDTVNVNGVIFTAAAASDAPTNKFKVESDLTTTLTTLVALLNASTDPKVAVATYVKTSGTLVTINYDTKVDAGNDFTLAASAATPSGAKLTGGVTGDKIRLGRGETFWLTTFAGAASSFLLPDGNEGQEISLVLGTKGAGSNAVVTGTFAGGTTLTFDTAEKWAKLKFIAGKWRPIVNTGTIA